MSAVKRCCRARCTASCMVTTLIAFEAFAVTFPGPQTLKLKAAVKQWLEGKAKPPESPLQPGPWTLGPEPHWKHCRQQERPRAIGCPTASVGAQSPGAPHLQPGWRRFPGTIESNRSASPHYHDRLAGSNAPFEVWGHGDLQQVASAAPLISPAAQRKTCIHCSTTALPRRRNDGRCPSSAMTGM